jgi:hypothetical protein
MSISSNHGLKTILSTLGTWLPQCCDSAQIQNIMPQVTGWHLRRLNCGAQFKLITIITPPVTNWLGCLVMDDVWRRPTIVPSSLTAVTSAPACIRKTTLPLKSSMYSSSGTQPFRQHKARCKHVFPKMSWSSTLDPCCKRKSTPGAHGAHRSLSQYCSKSVRPSGFRSLVLI